MTTFRAAYIPDNGSSTSGGMLLTSEEHAALDDSELLAEAKECLAEINPESADVLANDIVIGERKKYRD